MIFKRKKEPVEQELKSVQKEKRIARTFEKIKELEVEYPKDEGFFIYCKAIEEYSNRPAPPPYGYEIFATNDPVTPITATVFSQCWLIAYEVGGYWPKPEENSIEHIDVYDLNKTFKDYSYAVDGDSSLIDKAQFTNSKEAEEWAKNWCENAKTYQLWKDLQFKTGQLTCGRL